MTVEVRARADDRPALGARTGEEPDLSPAGRTATIAAAIACVALVGTGLSLTIPLLSLELARMGVTGSLVGLNTATAGLASIVTLPFAPRLAARLGTLPLILACVLVSALCLPAFAALRSLAWWFPIRFVLSAALGILFALSEYWINAAAPPGRRGLVLGIYATVLALGFALGPAILAVVGTRGWPPYLAGAALFGLGALPPLMARGHSPEVPRQGGQTLLTYLRAAPAATLAALVFGAVETGGFAILPLYGTALGLSPERAAGLVSLVALGNVAVQIPAGLLSDRVDRRRMLLAAGLGGALGAAVMPWAAATPLLLAGLLVAWGGVIGTLYTVGLAHLGSRFTGADLAGANAAFVLLYTAGLVVGPPLVGAGLDAHPPHGFALALAAIFTVYVALVGTRLWQERRPAG